MPHIDQVLHLLGAVSGQGGVLALAVVLTWRPTVAERLIEAFLFGLVFLGVALGRGGKVSEQLAALFTTYLKHHHKGGGKSGGGNGHSALL